MSKQQVYEMDNEKITKQDYEIYKAERDKYIDIKRDNIKGQDKIIITISSALFGILLTMFNKDMFAGSEVARLLLILLLTINSVTFIVNLLSFYFGNKSIDKNIEIMEAKMKGKEYDGRNCWSDITDYCNGICIATTALTFMMLSVMIFFKIF